MGTFSLSLTIFCFSVGLNVGVDVSDELHGGVETDGAQHHEHNVAQQQRVAKVVDGLQGPAHLGPVHVVEYRVQEDVQSSRSAYVEEEENVTFKRLVWFTANKLSKF